MDSILRHIELFIEDHPTDTGAYRALLDKYYIHIQKGEKEYHRENRMLRSGRIEPMISQTSGKTRYEFAMVLKKSLLIDAQVDFDAYMRYIEWERDYDKQFYLPRRAQLSPVVDTLQDLADDKLDLAAISLPPGVGKSTTAIFFLCWLAGKNPELPILGGSHNNSFLRGVYDECLRVIDAGGEYLWRDVFPNVPLVSTNAKDLRIDLQKGKRFETLEFTSIGSGNAGKVRAGNLLYCDDLVEGIEQALSEERMEKLWNEYTTDLRQRKIGNCKELHIATRWSVNDPIGRLERQYEGNDRARFIAIPALNERDESNFDYGGSIGFTTKMYHEQRAIMDDASWRALFMNQPINREGVLYRDTELRRFFELPEGEPEAIIAVCDTKDKGSDYAVLPVVAKYGQDYYLTDVLCDNSNPDVVDARMVEILVRCKVQMARFESNSAGGRVAEKVQDGVKARGGITHITTKFTTQNKETKIIVNSPWVKEHVLFLDKSKIEAGTDYARMMQMLCGYSMLGKNKHDDVPDAMAMLSEYAQSFLGAKVEAFKRPF